MAEGAQLQQSFLARELQQHAQVMVFTLGRLSRNPLGALLTAAVIGITLALPAGLHVLLQNISALSYSWEGTLQASLFLKDTVPQAQGEALTQTLRQRPGIAAATYISRDESLQEFRKLSGFGEALDVLADNPLPAVIVVTPYPTQSASQIDQLIQDLALLPEVEQAKLDQKWLQRLFAILAIVQRGVLLIAGLLALAVIVIVGNTIRLDIQNRRDEIVVMKLVGAPDRFIRRPFLYTGFWFGLGGGVIAWLLIQVALLLVAGPTQALTGLYDSNFYLTGLGFPGALALLAMGIALGWTGAFWTVSRHLAAIEPT